MLKDLSILIKFVLRGAIKAAMALPWYMRDAMNYPTDHDNVLCWLPYAHYVNPQGLEENTTIESQCPEYSFVVVNAHKSVERIFEDNIISIDIESGFPLENIREVLPQGSNRVADVNIVALLVLVSVALLLRRRRRRERGGSAGEKRTREERGEARPPKRVGNPNNPLLLVFDSPTYADPWRGPPTAG